MERIEITNAIYALKSDFKGCKYVEEPTNESEYEAIEWVIGLDSINSCVYGTRPSDVPDWTTAKSKFDTMVSELSMSNLRAQRNVLLAETDWSQGTDVPDALKTKYTEYRQALRDITKTYISYEDVVWPTKPE